LKSWKTKTFRICNFIAASIALLKKCCFIFETDDPDKAAWKMKKAEKFAVLVKKASPGTEVAQIA